jgi:nucleoid-associated protein YgaU
MGRSARIGLFLLMGLIVALARLIEVEIGKARPQEEAPPAALVPGPEVIRKRPRHSTEHHHPTAPARPKATAAPVAASPVAVAPAPDVEGQEWPKGPIYTVKKGETLGQISLKVLGSSHLWQKLFDANATRLADPKAVKAGMRLVVPPKG